MGGPIARMVMPGMISPPHSAENHQLGIVMVVAVAEDLHGAVIALWDLLVQFLAEFADRC